MFFGRRVNLFGNYSVRFRGGVLVKKRETRTPFEELVGFLTKCGNKRRAKEVISYAIMFFFKKKYLPQASIYYFNIFWERELLSKISPVFDLKKKRSGPNILYIPKPIRMKKSRLYAYKWFLFSVFTRKEGTLRDKFVFEVLAIVKSRGYFFLEKKTRRLRNQSKTLELCKDWHVHGMENIALMTRFSLPGKSRSRKWKRNKRLSRKLKSFLPELF